MAYRSTLRSYPTQPLRGLGATSQQQQAQMLLIPLINQVRSGLDDLVSTAKAKTREIADDFKNNWFTFVRAAVSFINSKEDADEAADQWARNIVGYAENVRFTLTKTDASGQPFFVRKPELSQQLLRTAKDDLNGLIKDFGDEVKNNSFKAIVSDILESIIAFLLQIAQIVVVAFGGAIAQFPIGGIAVAAVAAVFVWYKFLR